jgi:hypothetical protein
LAERHEVGIGTVVEPPSFDDESLAEIAEMGDGPPNDVSPSLRKARKTSSGPPCLFAGGFGEDVRAIRLSSGDIRLAR